LLINNMKLLAIALLLAMLPSFSHAALTNWDINVDVQEDRTSVWTVALEYDQPVSKSDYFVLAKVDSYEVLADGRPASCSISRDIGVSIVCSNINARNIVYRIKTGTAVNEIFQNFRLFTYKFSATQITNKFSVKITLPLGAVLVEEIRLMPLGFKPFEPESGKEGSDGRRIFVQWTVDKPQLGETLDVSIVYEQFSETLQLNIFIFIVGAAIVALFIVLFTFFRRRSVRELLPVLTEGERKVVEILLKERKAVDQRQIVKETDFSKAKVSRIIHDLVERGVVEKTGKGRKNLITLKKSVKVENVRKPESGEKKGQISI